MHIIQDGQVVALCYCGALMSGQLGVDLTCADCMKSAHQGSEDHVILNPDISKLFCNINACSFTMVL